MEHGFTNLEMTAVREMTAAMLAAAESSHWQEVRRIDEARADLLKLISADALTDARPAVRDLLKEALAATREVEQRIAAERDRVGGELRQLKQRGNAAQRYHSFSRTS